MELPPLYDRGTTEQKAQQKSIGNSSSFTQSINLDHKPNQILMMPDHAQKHVGYKINVHGSQFSTEKVQRNLYWRLLLTLDTIE